MTTPVYAHLTYLLVSPFLQDSPSPPRLGVLSLCQVYIDFFDLSLIIVVSKLNIIIYM